MGAWAGCFLVFEDACRFVYGFAYFLSKKSQNEHRFCWMLALLGMPDLPA
jgi:hypothetical protein